MEKDGVEKRKKCREVRKNYMVRDEGILDDKRFKIRRRELKEKNK